MVAVGIEWVGTSISLDFQMISGGLGGLIGLGRWVLVVRQLIC